MPEVLQLEKGKMEEGQDPTQPRLPQPASAPVLPPPSYQQVIHNQRVGMLDCAIYTNNRYQL